MSYNRRSFLQASSWASLAFVPGIATVASGVHLSTEERQLISEAHRLFKSEDLAQPMNDEAVQRLLRPTYRLSNTKNSQLTFVNSNYERIQIRKRNNKLEVVIHKL